MLSGPPRLPDPIPHLPFITHHSFSIKNEPRNFYDRPYGQCLAQSGLVASQLTMGGEYSLNHVVTTQLPEERHPRVIIQQNGVNLLQWNNTCHLTSINEPIDIAIHRHWRGSSSSVAHFEGVIG